MPFLSTFNQSGSRKIKTLKHFFPQNVVVHEKEAHVKMSKDLV